MQCLICLNKNFLKILQVKEMMMGKRDSFNYFHCENCDSLQIKNVPDNLSEYYPIDYYSFKQNSRSNFVQNYATRLRNHFAVYGEGIFGKYLNFFKPNPSLNSMRVIKPKKNWKILDVGCGSGELLLHLKMIGFKNLEGIDPFLKEEINYSEGLKIRNIRLEEQYGKWDLIMFHHSFEHMQNPDFILKQVYRLLDEKGFCIIRTPNLSSHAWRKYGAHWVQIDAPRHIVIYSTNSLKLISKNNGLILFDMKDDSDGFQFWGSEQYLKDIALNDDESYLKNKNNMIFKKSELIKFDKDAKDLNSKNDGDQTIYYFKKIFPK